MSLRTVRRELDNYRLHTALVFADKYDISARAVADEVLAQAPEVRKPLIASFPPESRTNDFAHEVFVELAAAALDSDHPEPETLWQIRNTARLIHSLDAQTHPDLPTIIERCEQRAVSTWVHNRESLSRHLLTRASSGAVRSDLALFSWAVRGYADRSKAITEDLGGTAQYLAAVLRTMDVSPEHVDMLRSSVEALWMLADGSMRTALGQLSHSLQERVELLQAAEDASIASDWPAFVRRTQGAIAEYNDRIGDHEMASKVRALIERNDTPGLGH